MPRPWLWHRPVLRHPGRNRADRGGLDRSADQLRIACGRSRHVVQADAAALPFGDATFPAVVTLWVSTDVDVGSGLIIEHAAELGERPVPTILALRGRKPVPGTEV